MRRDHGTRSAHAHADAPSIASAIQNAVVPNSTIVDAAAANAAVADASDTVPARAHPCGGLRGRKRVAAHRLTT